MFFSTRQSFRTCAPAFSYRTFFQQNIEDTYNNNNNNASDFGLHIRCIITSSTNDIAASK